MLHRFLRVAGRIVLVLAAIAATLYVIGVIVNWNDEAPNANAQRFEQRIRDRPAVADADNGYTYLMGIEAPPTVDPTELGSRRIAWIEQVPPGGLFVADDDPLGPDPPAPTRPPAVDSYLDTCAPGVVGCAAAFEAAADELAAWQSAEPLLLPRYQALIAHPGWREPPFHDPASPLAPYKRAVNGQKMLLLAAYARARQGEAEAVRDMLDRDLRFWRHVLAHSDMLISKMVATAAVTRHFQLGNLVLRALPPEHAAQAMPDLWREPLSDAERSMQRSMLGEYIFAATLFRKPMHLDPDAWEGPLLRRLQARLMLPFYQPQATINIKADLEAAQASRMEVPLQRYPAVLAEVSRDTQREQRPRSPYNLVGQVLVYVAMIDYTKYAARVGDIEGVRRAALAAVTLRSANVPKTDVAAHLASLDLRNPYDGRPFEWTGTAVQFRGLEPAPRGLHPIDY